MDDIFDEEVDDRLQPAEVRGELAAVAACSTSRDCG